MAAALRRSRGGFSTQIPALTDALGNPLDFELTGGQAADITPAEGLLPKAPVGAVVADKGYDADAFIATVRARGAVGVIPPRKHRKQPREYDRHSYQERHLNRMLLGQDQALPRPTREKYGGKEQRCADKSDSALRAARGGSWDSVPRTVRSANRFRTTPDTLGVRLARTPWPCVLCAFTLFQ